MNQKNCMEYNIGLDIGTNSVGWAVTDLENNILKYKNRNMWGARLFDEGTTAAQTRTFRGTRRRIERRRERIKILQSLLLDDMEKDYPNFFHILNETSKIEKENKYNLFSELDFSDKDYYKKYPTIYHLRKELMEKNECFDFRLVYLAIHHIIKYRGNFLYEGELKNNNDEIDGCIEIVLKYLSNEFNIEFISNVDNLKNILKDKNIAKSTKKDELLKLFDYEKEEKTVINDIVSSILGCKFDVNRIFNINVENSKISFGSDILNEEDIKNELQNNDEIYDALNKIYNWFILKSILQGNSSISDENFSISDAYISKCNKYKKDLLKLKKIYKEKLNGQYNEMFRKEEKGSYALYDKNISESSIEDLYKRIKQDLEGVPECQEKTDIMNEIEKDNFLKKINTTENAAIPYQLHYQELEKILDNQSKFYSSIKENKDYILALMKFRIPYYVGPLAKNNNSKFAWIVRNNEEKIRPWNFEQVVDIDATAEKFIRRMTNKCTYLLNEDVIPKQSILYSEFCVRNELANIRVNGYKLSPETKDLIIDKLFKIKKSVKLKDFKQFLIDFQIYKNIETISGLAEEDKFMSNMISYIDMREIFGNIDENNIEMIEKIIEWVTIFEDKKILKRKIKNEYNLDSKIIDKIARKNYSGWSRLSKELLVNIKAYDDGKNIMEKLRSSEFNFMQIINNKDYGFDKQIESRIESIYNDKFSYDMIDEMPVSPANKRAVWQTVKVVNEIVKIMKKDPKNIYIEFARDEESKKGRKDNRAKALLKIYNSFADELKTLGEYNPKIYQELKDKQSDKDFNERLYLYFTQMGKCMYSSKPLNIDELSRYEVDHILPQCYVKDDSLSNKVLVYKEENQRKSGSLLLNEQIINRQENWWKLLYKNKLIDEKKLHNLTRRKMFETTDDKVKFVSRQLVETRQSTKYVTNLLVNQYKNSNIFAIRANLTHNFRETFEIYKNRNVNDYHHAQDAYIISVIGNVIDTKLHYKDDYIYKEYVKKYIRNSEENSISKNKSGIIMGMIINNTNIKEIKKILNYKDCFVTHKLEEQTGEFYNQTLYSPKDKNKKPVIPLKENKDVEKYGGYSGENKAYFTIFSYIDDKNKQQIELIGIPIKVSYDIKNEKTTIEGYIKSKIEKGASNVRIIKTKILKYQEYLDENNEPMVLLSDSEIGTNKQLIVSNDINKLIYIMNKSQLKEDEKLEILKEMSNVYDYLLSKMKNEYKSYNSIYEKLNSMTVRDKFNNADYKEKILAINGIIDIMHKGQGNLKSLNESDRSGRKSGQKFKTDRIKKMTFIDKSVTGMYERRYKVDGMENGSNS